MAIALLFGLVAGLLHGRTALERLGYAVAFCSVSAGVLPAAIWYLTLRPDALQLELALPILLGGLPGGLLVLERAHPARTGVVDRDVGPSEAALASEAPSAERRRACRALRAGAGVVAARSPESARSPGGSSPVRLPALLEFGRGREGREDGRPFAAHEIYSEHVHCSPASMRNRCTFVRHYVRHDRAIGSAALVLLGFFVACGGDPRPTEDLGANESALKKNKGQNVFRYDTFGDEQLWTDQLQMHVVIATSVPPTTALAVGLKVDADALPPGALDGADLSSPATTVALIAANAVVGIMGKVTGNGDLVEVGITCALCHSTVDDAVAPGIGHRLDGWPNRDLDPGAIIALSPALTDAQRQVYQSWGPGRYDPRFNQDGINHSVLIPPAYGLQGVALETYTGDGPISYWNAYVAITQMGGKGDFTDPRIGLSIEQNPDLVTRKLPDLLAYQLSLPKPPPPAGSFDVAAAARGQAVFEGAGLCASCHQGSVYTDAGVALHPAAETGMDPLYATRSATGLYRTTPLRALWQHPPYFHDGSAASLEAVVDHYDAFLVLGLTAAEKNDLVEFLKSL